MKNTQLFKQSITWDITYVTVKVEWSTSDYGNEGHSLPHANKLQWGFHGCSGENISWCWSAMIVTAQCPSDHTYQITEIDVDISMLGIINVANDNDLSKNHEHISLGAL